MFKLMKNGDVYIDYGIENKIDETIILHKMDKNDIQLESGYDLASFIRMMEKYKNLKLLNIFYDSKVTEDIKNQAFAITYEKDNDPSIVHENTIFIQKVTRPFMPDNKISDEIYCGYMFELCDNLNLCDNESMSLLYGCKIQDFLDKKIIILNEDYLGIIRTNSRITFYEFLNAIFDAFFTDLAFIETSEE